MNNIYDRKPISQTILGQIAQQAVKQSRQNSLLKLGLYDVCDIRQTKQSNKKYPAQ